MKISSMSKYILGTLAAAGILAGCSSSGQSGFGQTGTMPSMSRGGVLSNVAAMYPQPLHQHGLAPAIVPDKKTKGGGEYAYISGIYADAAYVYSYSNGKFGKETGTVSGLDEPQGVCANATDVWIANTGTSQILEYKVGKTTSSGSLSDPGEYPTDCAMDKAGDIAVSNIESTAGSAGDIVIYTKGKGNGKAVTCPNLERYYFDTYDSKGNLWVDGQSGLGSGFGFCEVKAGKKSGTAITLSVNPEFPGGVQMYGSDPTILDQDADTIDVYTIKGTKGKETKTISLGSGADLVCDWLDGTSYALAANISDNEGESWKLPKGGNPYSTASAESALGIAVGGSSGKKK